MPGTGHQPDMVGVCAQSEFLQWRHVSKCNSRGSVVSCSDYSGETGQGLPNKLGNILRRSRGLGARDTESDDLEKSKRAYLRDCYNW